MLGLGRGRLRLSGVARLLSGFGAILFAYPLLFQTAALAVEIGDGGFSIALAALLAGKVLFGLLQAGFGFELRGGDTLGFGRQCIVRHAQALQSSSGGRLVVAQRRQRRCCFGLRRGGKTDQACEVGDLRLGFLQPLSRLGQFALGIG